MMNNNIKATYIWMLSKIGTNIKIQYDTHPISFIRLIGSFSDDSYVYLKNKDGSFHKSYINFHNLDNQMVK